MNIIEQEFKTKGILRGNAYRYQLEDAIAIINRCKELNKRILGIDSFIITEKVTQPFLEHSIDFKIASDNDNIWDEAISFVKSKGNMGFVFEIVYE